VNSLKPRPTLSYYFPLIVRTDFVQEAGIVLQCFGNMIFTLVAYLLYRRTRLNSFSKDLPTPFPKTAKFKVFVATIIISDAAIIIRAIYRVVELAQGWRGYLLTTEPWFYGFDTLPMVLCMAGGTSGFYVGQGGC